MPEELKEWPIKPMKHEQFMALFDGKIYRVKPDEFDCDTAEELAKSIRYAASKTKTWIRLFLTLDGHVVVSRQPEGYVPTRGGGRPSKKAAPAPASA